MAEIQILIGIVDDETLMLEYLKEVVMRMNLPGVVCQTCKSGKEALATWADNPPAILVTDIMMYDMNGLDLIEAIQNLGWDTDVIIISGHDNFEYAQKAMVYGVHRYLLKPVQEEVLASTIQSIADKRNKQKSDHAPRSFSQVCRQIQHLMCVAVMEFGVQRNVERETDALVEALASFLRGKLDHGEFLWHENNRLLLLLRFAGRESIRRRCRELAEIGRHWLQHNMDVSNPYYYVGTGEAGKGLDALQQSRLHACEALEQGFFGNWNGVWMWDATRYDNYLPESEDLNNFRKTVAELSVAISLGEQEDVKNCVEHHFQAQNAVKRHKNRENFFSTCSMLYLMLGLLLEEQGYDNVLQPVDTFSQSLKRCCSYRETVKYLTEDLCEVNEYIRTTIQKHNSRLAFRIKKYLMKNFEKQVNLEEVSQHFYLSPAYLSSYFKKETGTTMTDYVVMLRIQKAKKLLCETNKTVDEVAKEVGYSNHNYFSVVFKKTTGYSPMQYRRKSVGVQPGGGEL